MVIPYVQILFLLLFVFVWQEMDWTHLFPLAGPGIKPLIQDSAVHSSIFGELILLSAFVPFIRTFKDFRFASWLGLAISCGEIALFRALYVMVFDYPAMAEMAYPFQHLTRTAIIGDAITHVEAIFLGFWEMMSVIHFSLYLYLTVYIFSRTLRINEFEPLLLPMTGLVFLCGLIPENSVVAIRYREILLITSSGILLGLPFLLWILDRWKGGEAS